MENKDLFDKKCILREKRAWCRCKIKLIDSMSKKVSENAKTGKYGLTGPERMVLKEFEERIKEMPDF